MKTLKVLILGVFFGLLLKLLIEQMRQNKQLVRSTGENIIPKMRRRSIETETVIRTTAKPKPAQRKTGKDNLKVIKGIGPAAEKKLNDAGVHTYAELAQLSVEELQTILGHSKRVMESAKEMIKEAKKLAQ